MDSPQVFLEGRASELRPSWWTSRNSLGIQGLGDRAGGASMGGFMPHYVHSTAAKPGQGSPSLSPQQAAQLWPPTGPG